MRERAENVDLTRRVVDVIVAANDVRDAHVEVVDHDAEVVRRHAVGSQEHEVIELTVREVDSKAAVADEAACRPDGGLCYNDAMSSGTIT